MNTIRVISLTLCLNIPMAHANKDNPSFQNYCVMVFTGALTAGWLMGEGIGELLDYREHARQLANPNINHNSNLRDKRDDSYVRGITNITASTLLIAGTAGYAYTFAKVIHDND